MGILNLIRFCNPTPYPIFQMKFVRRLSLFFIATLLPMIAVEWSELPLPSGPDSDTPSLARAQDGNVYVSWTAPVGEEQHALWISRFDRETKGWHTPVQIARGANWFINWADNATVVTGLRGRVAAVWYVHNEKSGYHAVISTSPDHGQTWTSPQPLSTESDGTEFVSFAPLLNGSWLAVWLDSRARANSGSMQLRSRIIGSDAPDTLIDERVCDCCPISTLVLPNGSVLAAYRDRSDDEVRDIAYQSYNRGTWSEAAAPALDGWRIAGCPVNGASLSRRSGHVATAWFTGAGDKPQVMTARSNNLGRSWNVVARLDDPEHPAKGAVRSTVLRDGSQWVSWVEDGGTIALRTLARDGGLSVINRMPGKAAGKPSMVVLSNNSSEAAQLLVARVEADGVKTHIASLPMETTTTLDDCGCDGAERGHAVRGKIVSVLKDRSALLVAHEEIPGVMMAMTMSFQVDPRVLDLVKPDQAIAARMERRDDGKWLLFSIRILESVN